MAFTKKSTMPRVLMVALVVAIALGALMSTSVSAQQAVTAFVNVSVIPMDREQVFAGQTVLVRGTRISELGPTDRVRVPPEAVRVDGRGKYLVPGLGDMHTHVGMNPENMGTLLADSVLMEHVLFLLLANGVTTIRNLDYIQDGGRMLRLRDRAAAGKVWSPRIYAAGYLEIDGLNSPGAGREPKVQGQKLEDIAAQVMVYKAAGYDLIKYRKILPVAFDSRLAFDSLVAAARRVGIPLVGHVPSLDQALQGFASIEHLTAYGIQGQKNQRAEPQDTSKFPTMAAATQRAGIWNCPTLALTEIWAAAQINQQTLAQWPGVRYLSARTQASWKKDLSILGNRNGLTTALPVQRQLIKVLQDSGAGLLLGTDMPVPGMIPGFSVHQELAALVRAGLTPYQALVTGTRNVAAYFGTIEESGTIAAGKRADLVLLPGNPLADIRHTSPPAGVMIGGRWLTREALDRRLAEIEAYAVAP